MYSWVDHMHGHTTRHNKFKKTEIISSILPDHNDMKLEINHTCKYAKKKKTCGETHTHGK